MYELQPLPYSYDALEPWIDAKTMEIHHSKHHKTYCDKFNEVLGKHPELFSQTAEDLIQKLDTLPEDIKAGVRNFGGGFINHNLFWNILGPHTGKIPSGMLLEIINRDFGSFDVFKETFNKSALGQFGSGWAWLVKDNSKKLSILNLPNQDSPLSKDLTPILCIDVWEHAYYLKYQNKRAEYIENWWNVVNWSAVETLYKK